MATFSKCLGYVEGMIDDFNEAMTNSAIAATMDLLCVEKLDIPEINDANAMLTAFQDSKGILLNHLYD